MSKIILASSSIYRQELLKRLPIKFTSTSPNINEARINDENFGDLARRLSNEKAEVISKKNPSAFVIGSDQTAEFKNKEVRKIFNAFDLEISRLKRTRFGPIFLPSSLKIGKTMELSNKEIDSIKGYGR